MTVLSKKIELGFLGNHPNGLGSERIVDGTQCRPVIKRQMLAAFTSMTEAQVLQHMDSAICINVSGSGDLSPGWFRYDSAVALLAIGEAALNAKTRQKKLALQCYGLCPELLRQLHFDATRMVDPHANKRRQWLIAEGLCHTETESADQPQNPPYRMTYSSDALLGHAIALIQVSDGSRSAEATAAWFSHPNYIEGAAAAA
jgi:hypothetical protein